jgi:uncharacterized protein YlxP (DUF503 family)
MVVGVLKLDLLIHGSHSLKQKRSVVKSILGRCRVRFPVSCAEIGHQDLWQRALVGFAVLENSEASVHQILQKVIEEVERIGLAEVCGQEIELIHY